MHPTLHLTLHMSTIYYVVIYFITATRQPATPTPPPPPANPPTPPAHPQPPTTNRQPPTMARLTGSPIIGLCFQEIENPAGAVGDDGAWAEDSLGPVLVEEVVILRGN